MKRLFQALAVSLGIFFLGGWVLAKYYEQSDTAFLDREKARVLIGSTSFDFPLRFLYYEAFERRGAWTQPKAERIPVKAFTISVLLPDMRPYSDKDKSLWLAPQHASRIDVLILQSNGDWFNTLKQLSVDQGIVPSRFGDTPPGMVEVGSQAKKTYFAAEPGVELAATCNQTSGNKVRCGIHSSYSKDIKTEYYLNGDDLGDLMLIDFKVKKTLDRFSVLGGRQ